MRERSGFYLAGPMTGLPDYNYPAFEEAAGRIRASGREVKSPHEIDFNETQETRGSKQQYSYYARCILLLIECKHVVLLPGWSKSIGARRELDLAMTLDMGIWYYMSSKKDPLLEIK